MPLGPLKVLGPFGYCTLFHSKIKGTIFLCEVLLCRSIKYCSVQWKYFRECPTDLALHSNKFVGLIYNFFLNGLKSIQENNDILSSHQNIAPKWEIQVCYASSN